VPHQVRREAARHMLVELKMNSGQPRVNLEP
jgi:hypothetical protein